MGTPHLKKPQVGCPNLCDDQRAFLPALLAAAHLALAAWEIFLRAAADNVLPFLPPLRRPFAVLLPFVDLPGPPSRAAMAFSIRAFSSLNSCRMLLVSAVMAEIIGDDQESPQLSEI